MENIEILKDEIATMVAPIYAQREEILIAFIVKYGLNPNEIEQVVQYSNNGMKWFVRKKPA